MIKDLAKKLEDKRREYIQRQDSNDLGTLKGLKEVIKKKVEDETKRTRN